MNTAGGGLEAVSGREVVVVRALQSFDPRHTGRNIEPKQQIPPRLSQIVILNQAICPGCTPIGKDKLTVDSIAVYPDLTR